MPDAGVAVPPRGGGIGVVGINLGCGPVTRDGWINCDARDLPGVDLCCDARRGIPLASGRADIVAAIHLLQDLAWNEIDAMLAEIHRVLRPGGTARLSVPDLDKALLAYLRRDTAYFHVPDDHARSVGAKLVTQLIWYGSVRTPVNFEFLHERLAAAGFRAVQRCGFGVTRSPYPQLAMLDNRPRESLFVEAVK